MHKAKNIRHIAANEMMKLSPLPPPEQARGLITKFLSMIPINKNDLTLSQWRALEFRNESASRSSRVVETLSQRRI